MTNFKTGERCLGNFGRLKHEDIDIIRPVVYMATYGDFHWVLMEQEDIDEFYEMNYKKYDPNFGGILTYPCKELTPFPKIKKDVDWTKVKRNQKILIDYVDEAYFALYIEGHEAFPIAVFIDEKENFVTADEAVDIYWLPEHKCSLPI